jgi:hypothetical protein
MNTVDLLSLGDIKEVGVAVAEKKSRGVIGLVPLRSSQGELPDCICYVVRPPIAWTLGNSHRHLCAG